MCIGTGNSGRIAPGAARSVSNKGTRLPKPLGRQRLSWPHSWQVCVSVPHPGRSQAKQPPTLGSVSHLTTQPFTIQQLQELLEQQLHQLLKEPHHRHPQPPRALLHQHLRLPRRLLQNCMRMSICIQTPLLLMTHTVMSMARTFVLQQESHQQQNLFHQGRNMIRMLSLHAKIHKVLLTGAGLQLSTAVTHQQGLLPPLQPPLQPSRTVQPSHQGSEALSMGHQLLSHHILPGLALEVMLMLIMLTCIAPSGVEQAWTSRQNSRGVL